jgi:hypothetical protein
MKISKILIFCLLLISFFSISFSTKVDLTINESSKLTKLLAGGYSLEANGILKIKNPSNFSKIFEFDFPLDLDSLIGILEVNDSLNKFDFKFTKIHGYMIEPNETIEVSYRIFGIISYDIYNKTNGTILNYYIKEYNFLTNPIINLQKPEREGYLYNNDTSLNSTPISNSSRRLISSFIQNPTDFDLNLKEVKLFRTSVSNPFFNDGVLINTFYNNSLLPFKSITLDYFDDKSENNSVYWVSNNIVIDYNLNEFFSKEFNVQSPPKSSGGSKNGGGGGGGNFYNVSLGGEKKIFDSILIKKEVDKTIVRNGDEFEVILKIVNINEFPIYNLSLFEQIPENYEILNVSDSAIISNKNLVFKIDKVLGYGTKIIKYTLKNNDGLKGITYLYPSKLIYRNKSFYSDGILLINDILPDKKVFIQKEIEEYNDRFDKIKIKVKNLGSIPLEDILISEEIPENVIIKEISQIFYEKGIWKIKKLDAGEEWEVSYLIEKGVINSNLPNVFGVDKANVYGTIISSEKIITVFKEEPKTIEKVGMLFAVGLLVFYLLF